MPGAHDDKSGDKLPALKPPPHAPTRTGGAGPSSAQVRRARSVFESAPRSSLPAAKILYGGDASTHPAPRPAQPPRPAAPTPDSGRPFTPTPPSRPATPTPPSSASLSRASSPSSASSISERHTSLSTPTPPSRPMSPASSSVASHGSEASSASLTPTPPPSPAPDNPRRGRPPLHFPAIATPSPSGPSGDLSPLVLGPGGNQVRLPAIAPQRAQTPPPRVPRPASPEHETAPGTFPAITNPRAIERAADYEGSNPVFNAVRSVVDRVRMRTPERAEVATVREKFAQAQETDRRTIGGLAPLETRAKALGHASTAASAIGSAIPLPGAGVAGSLVSASLTGAQAATERAAGQRYARAAAYEVAPPDGGPGYMQAQADLRHASAKQHVAAAVGTASQIPGASMVAKRATEGSVTEARQRVMTHVAHAPEMGGRARASSQEFDAIVPPPPRSLR